MDTNVENQNSAPVEGMKPAVVAIIVLLVLVFTIGIMYFMVIKPLKDKLNAVSGALDNATNTPETTTPEKGLLNNAGMDVAGRERVIKIKEDRENPKGLISPNAVELFNSQLLKP